MVERFNIVFFLPNRLSLGRLTIAVIHSNRDLAGPKNMCVGSQGDSNIPVISRKTLCLSGVMSELNKTDRQISPDILRAIA